MFLAGAAYNIFETTSLIYLGEISGSRFNMFGTLILSMSWAFGQIIFAGLNSFINSWRTLTLLSLTLPSWLLFLHLRRTLFESPLFLLSSSRFSEAKSILTLISLINKRPSFTFHLEGEIDESGFNGRVVRREEKDQIRIQSENYGVVDLFRFKSLRGITGGLLLLWFFRYFSYFGLVFGVESFGAEVGENFLLMAVAEMVACWMSCNL